MSTNPRLYTDPHGNKWFYWTTSDEDGRLHRHAQVTLPPWPRRCDLFRPTPYQFTETLPPDWAELAARKATEVCEGRRRCRGASGR